MRAHHDIEFAGHVLVRDLAAAGVQDRRIAEFDGGLRQPVFGIGRDDMKVVPLRVQDFQHFSAEPARADKGDSHKTSKTVPEYARRPRPRASRAGARYTRFAAK